MSWMLPCGASTACLCPAPYSPPLEAAVVPNAQSIARQCEPCWRNKGGISWLMKSHYPAWVGIWKKAAWPAGSKQDGEFVNAGELLFSVEGDKAVQEIEALDSGFLRIPPTLPSHRREGAGGTARWATWCRREKLHSFRAPARTARPTPQYRQTAGIAAAFRRPPAVARTCSAPAGAGQRIYISPYARRLAQGLGVEWQKPAGQRPRGRIMAQDVRAAAVRTQAAPPQNVLPAIPARRSPAPAHAVHPQENRRAYG